MSGVRDRQTAATGRDRLIAAGAALAALGGVRAVTARAVAETAGASPSAINYAFGSREGLLSALFEDAQTRSAERGAAGLADLDGLNLEPAMLGDWLAAWVQTEALQARQLTLLRRELFLQIERLPALTPIARQWRDDQRAFCRALLDRFGLNYVSETPLTEALRAVADCFPSDTATPAHAAWAGTAICHLAARLAGAAPPPSTWRCALEARAAALAPESAVAPPQAEHILDGAIRLLAQVGAGGLSHRALAQESRVPLASTTHYFEGRDAILRAAFERLYLRLSTEARAIAPPGEGVTLEAFAAGLADASLDGQGDIRMEVAALDELLAAARRDRTLEPLATHLIASRGVTTAGALAGLRGLAPDAGGREDAFMLSIMGLAAIPDLRLTPPRRRVETARELAETRLRLLGDFH